MKKSLNNKKYLLEGLKLFKFLIIISFPILISCEDDYLEEKPQSTDSNKEI